MGIISVDNTDRLYWLGRYSERVYTTLKLFSRHYDEMIDQSEKSYETFCEELEIPCIYADSDDFITRYCFSQEDPNSIYSNLMRAYDNGIMLREEIGSETLSYIQLAVYAMQRAQANPALLIDFQKVMDNIMAFWGMADDSISSENVRNIIKVGKRVERIDLYARLHHPAENMIREVCRLAGRIPRTQMNYSEAALEALSLLVNEEKIDYNRIVYIVENELIG